MPHSTRDIPEGDCDLPPSKQYDSLARELSMLQSTSCQGPENNRSYRAMMEINEHLDLLIPKVQKRSQEEDEDDENWSMEVCGYEQDLEERIAALDFPELVKETVLLGPDDQLVVDNKASTKEEVVKPPDDGDF